MKNPKVIYVSKNELYPAFGDVDIKKQTAYVRKDLPASVKKFVTQHELYHLKDKSKNWIWREIKANFYGLSKHLGGFLLCAIMSLSPARLRLYYQRFKEGK